MLLLLFLLNEDTKQVDRASGLKLLKINVNYYGFVGWLKVIFNTLRE